MKIVCNDKFDSPDLKEYHKDDLTSVMKLFNIPETEEWVMFSTIHGLIFKCRFSSEFMVSTGHIGRDSVSRNDMVELLKLNTFRSISTGRTEITVKLTFSEDEL